MKITGNYGASLDGKMNEITINSPLGRALYLQEVGSTVHYVINEEEKCVSNHRKKIA